MGDGGLGIGDWGLGIGPNPQSPIPNPQSPIPILIYIPIKEIKYYYYNISFIIFIIIKEKLKYIVFHLLSH